MSKKKELIEKRARVHAELTDVLNAEQTAETRAKVQTMLADIDSMTSDLASIERADTLGASFAATVPAVDNTNAEVSAKQYRAAFCDWLCRGDVNRNAKGSVNGGAEERSLALLNKVSVDFRRAQTKEQRDQIAGTQSITYTQGAAGGFFVPAGFVYDVEKATKYFAPILDVVRVLETASGQELPYPTSNDTNQAWHVLGEAAQILDQGTSANYPVAGSAITTDAGNVGLGHVRFGAWKGSTGLIRVSLELLQDSAFNIEAFLQEAFAVRLGRGYEQYLTNGTGSSEPKGILPAIAASGAVAVTATGSSLNDGVVANDGTNSIGYQDLVNLIHSVDPTYRKGAKFMFSDSTLAHLKTRVDKFGRPLWVPSTRENEPDTVAGYSYVINQSFPSIAPSAKSVAFGAWQKFIARKVKDLQVLRLDERFADFGEVAYVGFSRIDSNLVDAGTHPLNVLIQHS
jgi:HK97 family phage major capsid protein